MKPVAIFRHYPTEGPGYFATFLEDQDIPWQLIRIDAGDEVPARATSFSGLVFMGGPMSVNDDLPWIQPALELIRHAVATGVPVLGHCLGGQLMAKALGATVSRNAVKEIGWGEVDVADNDVARAWFGDLRRFQSFHWHGETFSIPEGATRILSSQWCANQGFALDRHLALQCHVEMTEDMVKTWCDDGAAELAHHESASVQSVHQIQRQLQEQVAGLNEVARRLYSRWASALVHTRA